MFSGQFESFLDDELQSLVDVIEREAAPFPLPSLDTRRFEYCRLDFYRHDVRLVCLTELALPEPNKRYMLYLPIGEASPGPTIRFMDWTNAPIYEFNEIGQNDGDGRSLLELSRGNVLDYARFFFHFVRGKLGRFLIIERPEDVPWLAPSQPNDHKASGGAEDKHKDVEARIHPLRYVGHFERDFYQLDAIVLFKDALFSTQILIAPYAAELEPLNGREPTGPADMYPENTETFSVGQLSLCAEELLVESLHVRVDGPPTEFG
jgi:hypothetical protein